MRTYSNKIFISSICACAFLTQSFGEQSTYYRYLEQAWKLINYRPEELERQGVTGDGVNIGVLDSTFNTEHPSLQGKDKEILGENNYDKIKTYNDANRIRHGTHVTGIILGSKQGQNEPHGIAPGAKYYGVAFLDPSATFNNDNSEIYNLFADKKDVKIINHSWGTTYYPVINKDFDSVGWFNYQYKPWKQGEFHADEVFDFLKNNFNTKDDLYRLAKEKGILQVFAAGNEGMTSPNLQAVLPSYDHDLRSWLVVGSVSAQQITRDESTGELTIQK